MATTTRTRPGTGNTVPVGMQLGLSGLKRSYGYVYEELLAQLQGRRAVAVYQEMSENCSVIGAMLFAIDMFMRKVGWRVEAASQGKKDQDNAEFLAECKDDMAHTWADFISEVNSMLVFGWAWFEIVYKKRAGEKATDTLGNVLSKYGDNKVGWHKFDIRSQESWWRWDFDPATGDTIGMWQRPAPDYSERYLPRGKSLLFRTTSKKNNPEGASVLRTAYRDWYFLKRIEEIEAIGVERDLAGIPIAEVPAEMLGKNASPADQAMVASIVDLVQNVRRDQQEGIIWPQAYDANGNSLYKFSLLTSGGTRQFPTEPIIQRYRSSIAQTVLADFITIGNSENSAGSYALSTSKMGMFQSALTAWLDSIENVLNEEAIPRLFRLNGIKGPYPKFRHDIVQQPALTDLAVYISAMAGAGAQLFPDTVLENHLREIAHLPIREQNLATEAVEDRIISQQLATQLASSKAQQAMARRTQADANAEGVATQPQGAISETMQPLSMKPPAGGTGATGAASQTGAGGKQPTATPGAPTKSTGPVKSKLPPGSRRATVSTRAAQNTAPKSNSKPTSIAKSLKLSQGFWDALEKQRGSGKQVQQQVDENFPKKSMKWMKKADWSGPRQVPIASLDFSHERSWKASGEPARVRQIADHIKAGRHKPIITVRTPDNHKLEIVDGHHHALAYRMLGMDPVVFVGEVHKPEGPWDEMHSSQLVDKAAQCQYCGQKATRVARMKGVMQSIHSCAAHADQARADLRWQLNNEISPANPNPYEPARMIQA
jgi:hypothetical protein